MSTRYLICTLAIVVALVSCENYDPKKDPRKSGEFAIGVDESYTLMMGDQVSTFLHFNEFAKVTALYKPEAQVIRDLLSDTVRAAVICRTLTTEEKEYIRSRQHTVEEIKIAVDGVALVIHPENRDTALTLEQVRAIFLGKDTLWSQIDPNNTSGPLNVVFDNQESCNARYIREKFLGDGPLPANCFAVHSNQEVMDYVKKNKNALGVISVSWISDPADSTSRSFLDMVRVIAIQNQEAADNPQLFRQPVQSYIFDGTYPLTRDVYLVETAINGSVGTSFVSQVAGEKGQLIIKRMGMAPAQVSPRQIRIVN